MALFALLFRGDSLAFGQYCAPAVFVGDIDQNNLVNNADITAWQALFSAVPQGYTPCADLNRNGVLDSDDLEQLRRAVQFALPTGGGLGLQGRIPAFTISEFRSGQFPASVSQERYIEFRAPSSFPANYNYSKEFGPGYYLLFVARNNSTSSAQGAIKNVVNLQGVKFAVAGEPANLALVKDSSFTHASQLPPGLAPTTLPSSASLTFLNEQEFNTTLLLVYRRPTGPGYNSVVAVPAAGQRVDANQNCLLDNRYTNSSMPAPNQFPPWDLVLDIISIDRSLITTGVGGRGCIYGHGPLFEALPVNPNGVDEASFHVFRQGGSKELCARAQEYSTGLDTPGSQNPPNCAPPSCGSIAAGSCTALHGPFCQDLECCEFVCSQISACCDIAWDQGCVDLAIAECGVCGGLGTGSCLIAHDSPFCATQDCCVEVCASNPLCCTLGWDESCVAVAIRLCLQCGAAVLPNGCFQTSSYPYCRDAVCCANVCIVDPACCGIAWDEGCVSEAALFCPDLACGSEAAGDCCLNHGTPFCSDAECCSSVCAVDPFCCETIWDVQCVSTVLQYCPRISCACGGGGAEASCAIVHAAPGCASITCCNAVCNSDPFCCGVTWDASCVAAADELCATNPVCKNAVDSCIVVHADPGCSDPSCCDSVCTALPECCLITWDQACVDVVGVVCGGCGDVFAGDCRTPHPTPACDNAVCCALGCAIDPYCCATEWGTGCVALVLDPLTGCAKRSTGCGAPGARSCFTESFLQGCDDEVCCDTICALMDPFCCQVQWDAICAGEAITFAKFSLGCTLPANAASGRGDCLKAHVQRGCSDVQCSAAVCSIEPNCCNLVWDQACAEIAPFLCVSPGGCPGTESSFTVHASPGSLDPSCCNAVCFVRPECCTESWTSACVVLATARCRPASIWNVPCVGSCIEPQDHPGCEDVACGSAVCFVDALCCTELWDQQCASLARGLCCGLPGCGNSCNGSCLVVHNAPYCNDPYCCTAVCAEDPYCCLTSWDAFCAETAVARCATCGSVTAGSCFLAHANRGCADALCCLEICRADPFCCETQWDSGCSDAAQADTTHCASKIDCGDENAKDCCVVHYDSPKCRDRDCCETVCALDTENICRDFYWDAYCVELALGSADCICRRECGDACAGNCCEAHVTTGCKDQKCCDAVCLLDSYCCTTEWDSTCANSALAICNRGPNAVCPPVQCGDPSTGNCCVPTLGPVCSDSVCCAAVCQVDPSCCQGQWDAICVSIAVGLVDACPCEGPTCGSAGTGSCFKGHPTPFCDQGGCCSIICGKVMPECCTIAWDDACASFATIFCTP